MRPERDKRSLRRYKKVKGIKKSFNQKFPYIKWKDLEPVENNCYRHTLTECLFSYSNEEWKELKSKASPPKYPKLTKFDKFMRYICCYEEYSILI